MTKSGPRFGPRFGPKTGVFVSTAIALLGLILGAGVMALLGAMPAIAVLASMLTLLALTFAYVGGMWIRETNWWKKWTNT